MLAPVFRFVIAVFLFSTAVFSQQIQTIPREQAESPELQKLRPIWLEKLSKDVANLKLPENRATVDARLGDLYWKTDQNRARMLFNQAIDELIKAQQETKPLMDAGNLNTVYAFYNIRLQILRLIVRNDENLGFDLFIKSRPQIVSDALAGRPLPSGAIPGDMPLNVSYVSPPPNPTLGQTLIRQESEVEQSLASAVLASNPKRIADVLSRITPENLSNSTYYTLRNLSSKDPLAASTRRQ